MDAAPVETALQCFVAVARKHGRDLSVDRIKHDHALNPTDDISQLLPAIARQNGFRAKRLKLAWKDLKRLGDAYPIIARLSNGNSVIVAGFRNNMVGVLDPLADRPAVLGLDEANFCKSWSGDALLLRRNYAFADEDR